MKRRRRRSSHGDVMTDYFEAAAEDAQAPCEPQEPSVSATLRTHSSSVIAKTLEYKLLGDISAELLLRGQALEVLRGDVDAFGHDLVLEAGGVVRHIQLKAKVRGGKSLEITCHTDLTLKPSGCIIWITYDPETYSAVEYASFGGAAGEKLPPIGDVVAKRSTRNGEGDRPLRHQHRILRYGRFDKITNIPDLVDWLFVGTKTPDRSLKPQIVTGPADQPMLIGTGKVSILPISVNLTNHVALVSIVLGPGSVGDLVAMGGTEQHGSWCLIDLKTGSWELPPEIPDDDGAVAHAMHLATTRLQAQVAGSAAEVAR